MKPIKNHGASVISFLITLLILPSILVGSINVIAAQSNDPTNPTPLAGNTLNGNIAHKDAQSYYYTFAAGPGEITFSLSVKSNGRFSYLDLEVLDSNRRSLLKMDASSDGMTRKSSLRFETQQTLIMRISSARTSEGGTFALKLGGQISAVKAPTQPSKTEGSITPAKDSTPPVIRIISPATTRGQSVGSRITVTGEAIDESGVSEVLVRGQAARLDASGRFSAEIMLRVGENQIPVSATDIHGNRAEETFTINRAADSSPDNSLPPAEFVRGKYYALLIAAQDYNSQTFPRLDNPLKDSEKLFDALTAHYTFDKENVFLLKNPTRDEIISKFEALEKTIKKEDSLLIFYAGHGVWDEQRKQGYWIPIDVQGDSRSKWLSNSDVRDAIRGIKAQHTLLITDACFSGGILKGRGPAPAASPIIDQLMRMPSRTAMTSGTLTTVPDRSVFLEFFLKRLQENQDPYKTATEIFSSLRIAVGNNSPVVDQHGNRPTPQYGVIQEAGDEGGDFIFVRRQ